MAGFALSLESVNGALSQRMQAREYGLAEDYWDTYPEKVIEVGDGSKIAGFAMVCRLRVRGSSCAGAPGSAGPGGGHRETHSS